MKIYITANGYYYKETTNGKKRISKREYNILKNSRNLKSKEVNVINEDRNLSNMNITQEGGDPVTVGTVATVGAVGAVGALAIKMKDEKFSGQIKLMQPLEQTGGPFLNRKVKSGIVESGIDLLKEEIFYKRLMQERDPEKLQQFTKNMCECVLTNASFATRFFGIYIMQYSFMICPDIIELFTIFNESTPGYRIDPNCLDELNDSLNKITELYNKSVNQNYCVWFKKKGDAKGSDGDKDEINIYGNNVIVYREFNITLNIEGFTEGEHLHLEIQEHDNILLFSTFQLQLKITFILPDDLSADFKDNIKFKIEFENDNVLQLLEKMGLLYNNDLLEKLKEPVSLSKYYELVKSLQKKRKKKLNSKLSCSLYVASSIKPSEQLFSSVNNDYLDPKISNITLHSLESAMLQLVKDVLRNDINFKSYLNYHFDKINIENDLITLTQYLKNLSNPAIYTEFNTVYKGERSNPDNFSEDVINTIIIKYFRTLKYILCYNQLTQ